MVCWGTEREKNNSRADSSSTHSTICRISRSRACLSGVQCALLQFVVGRLSISELRSIRIDKKMVIEIDHSLVVFSAYKFILGMYSEIEQIETVYMYMLS